MKTTKLTAGNYEVEKDGVKLLVLFKEGLWFVYQVLPLGIPVKIAAETRKREALRCIEDGVYELLPS